MSLPTFSFLYSSRLGPILIGCIRVAIAVITPLVIRKISPKLLFMMSFFISAMAMTALGFMAYLQEYYPTSNYWNYLSWVPITMIILAVMTRSAGKVIIYKSRMGPFLWNRIWDLGWFWASWHYWKKWGPTKKLQNNSFFFVWQKTG